MSVFMFLLQEREFERWNRSAYAKQRPLSELTVRALIIRGDGLPFCPCERVGNQGYCRLVPGAEIIDFALYAFVKRTRTSQKISKINGSMVRIRYKVVLNKAGDRYFPSPTVESNLSGRF